VIVTLLFYLNRLGGTLRNACHAEDAVLLPYRNGLVVVELEDAHRADRDADRIAVALFRIDFYGHHFN